MTASYLSTASIQQHTAYLPQETPTLCASSSSSSTLKAQDSNQTGNKASPTTMNLQHSPQHSPQQQQQLLHQYCLFSNYCQHHSQGTGIYSGSSLGAKLCASTPKALNSCWKVTSPTLCPMPNRSALGTKPLYRALAPSSRQMVARVGKTRVYRFCPGSWLWNLRNSSSSSGTSSSSPGSLSKFLSASLATPSCHPCTALALI